MTKLVRRLLLLMWILFGTLPMSLLWRYTWHALVSIGIDPSLAQFLCMYSGATGFIIVCYTISELPVKD